MPRAKDDVDSDVEIEDATKPVEDEEVDGEEEDEEEEDDAEYEIETILDAKHGHFANGKIGYLVKWKGYGHDMNSWVMEDDAGNAQALIDEYWRSHNKERKSAGRKSVGRAASSVSAAARKRRSSVSASETEVEPAPKKRGRPPKAKNASDDEAPKSKSTTRKPAKSNGVSTKKTRNAKDTDQEDESEEQYEDMRKWRNEKSWVDLIEKIDTVERQQDGELYVYFKLKPAYGKTKERLCKVHTEECKKKMPDLLFEFYERNLRWRPLDPNGQEEA